MVLAIGRGQSRIVHYQACSKVAFAADRLAVAPAARRSCGYHGEAPGVTGCLTAVKRAVPAIAWQEEFVLENSGQPELPGVESVAVAKWPIAVVGPAVAIIMPPSLVVPRCYLHFGKNSDASLQLKYLASWLELDLLVARSSSTA